ncbi:MAG: CDP-diacylglycerol--serine O-phosphatidyltransferase [Bacteroidales bacterium]|nr:CDP-diacylglycerol--serine O-phosphatidyltransferase [Bacteroidales bacterium]
MNKLIIPNAITSLNILSGSLSIYISLTHHDLLHIAAALIILGSVFDFLDGFTARLLNAQSEFGKQMDSFSDLVSFGLAPAFIMLNLIKSNSSNEYLQFIALIIIVFSAIRLSIFNITNQKTEFTGLPTPAFALLIASIPLAGKIQQNLLHINIYTVMSNIYVLFFITIFFSVLLISKIKLFSLKFKNFIYKENKLRYIFLMFSVLLIVLFSVSSVFIIIPFYIIASLIFIEQKKA